MIVATKFGFRLKGGPRGVGDITSRPEDIKDSVEDSLKRLQTDHIDLLYQHRVDPNTPMEDVAGAVADLVRDGKVRFFGLSECGIANIRRAHAVHPVSALQSEYSLWERNLEPEIIPVLRELGIGLVPFCPLGRGFLAGGVKRAEDYPEGDFRRHDPRYEGENFDANVRAAGIVQDIAAEAQGTPGQVALAWLLQKGDDIVPIPGTKRRAFLEENLAAIDMHLDDTQMQRLDDALSPDKIAGPRYAPWIMATVDR